MERVEQIIKSDKFEIICINFKDKTLVIKDVLLDKILEILLLRYIGRGLCLHCSRCKTDDCDHTTFAFYSYEIGTLRTLRTLYAGYENTRGVTYTIIYKMFERADIKLRYGR